MYTALRKSLNKENDKGFTLIELLVVIIIIGILAAIAIPIFLNQRKKAVDASAKSDTRTIATQLETFYTDNQTFPTSAEFSYTPASGSTPGVILFGAAPVAPAPDTREKVILSPDNVPAVHVTATDFCVQVTNPKATRAFVWQSDNGGLQRDPAADCSAYGAAL